MKRLFHSITALFLLGFSFAFQSSLKPNDSIEKAKQKLKELNIYYEKNPDYEVKMRQMIFSSHISKVPEEQYTGYFKYKKHHEHSFILGIETIQNDQWRVNIDSNTKTITASLPKKTQPFSMETLNLYMGTCKSATVNDSGGVSIINLQFDPNLYPMSRLMIKIVNKRIASLDIWHTEKITTEQNAGIYPHTRIEYIGYREKAKYSNSEFDTKQILKSEQNKIIPIGKYKTYSFYDLRQQK